MSQPTRTPVEVLIFDRNRMLGSDVPVFSAALKQKVNTPVEKPLDADLSEKTELILEKIRSEKKLSIVNCQMSIDSVSVSRADSFGGQTNEFAQGMENTNSNIQYPTSNIQHSQIPGIDRDKNTTALQPEQSPFAENPEILRTSISSNGLLRFLESQIPMRITIPSRSQILLSATHRLGSIDWVFIPSRSLSFSQRLEPMLFAFKKVRKIVTTKMRGTRYEVREFRKRFFATSYKLSATSFARMAHTLTGASDELTATLRLHKMQFSLVSLASRTLIAGSMVLMLLTVGPMVALEAESWKQQIAYSIQNIASQAVESNYPTPTPNLKSTPVPTPTPDPSPEKQFQIIIPKIGVNSKVIGQVDAGNEEEYNGALKLGVAHAKGTGFPGEPIADNKTIFLFSHSTNGTWNISRYNALFYSLKDLVAGDTLSIWYKGREYGYTVSERKIVAPTDLSFLVPQVKEEKLILQTCWPPGTSSKRLLVIAKPTHLTP